MHSDILDVNVGLIYFFPKGKIPVDSIESDVISVNSPPPNGLFYHFAKEILMKTQADPKNGDLFLKNLSVDAMGLSAFVESKRYSSDTDKAWNKFPRDVQAFKESFEKLCNKKCNLLSFRLVRKTSKPVLNNYFYRVIIS